MLAAFLRHGLSGVLVIVLLLYAATIASHAYLELAFSQSRLPGHEGILEYVPGAHYLSDSNTFYCVDSARRKQGPPVEWIEGLCDTGPIRRVTIHSRYLQKSWDFYLDGRDRIRYKTFSGRQ